MKISMSFQIRGSTITSLRQGLRGVVALVFLPVFLLGGVCRADGETLHLYTWADYIKPEVVAAFEKKFHARVAIDTFDSNEAMYAKLKSGGAGYDLVTPSSYMAKVMEDQGLLGSWDHARLPNLRNIDGELLSKEPDQKMVYAVPYMISFTGIGFLKGKVTPEPESWEVFGRSEMRGRMTMLNDMRETIGAGLKFLGFSMNSVDPAQIEKARDVVIGWKKNLARFENEQYKSGLASAEFKVVQGYSGDILKAREDNPSIAFALPREGFSLATDVFTLLKGAKETALAHDFVNFLHEPTIAAENSAFISYLCPNSASYPLLPESFRHDPTLFPSAEVRARGEVIGDVGDALRLYSKAWDEIKAAR